MSSMPQDIMSLLAGQGGPAGPSGSLPPDIGALLGGGGSPPTPGGAAAGGDNPNADSSDLISQAIDILKQAHDVEPEPDDQATIATCIANLNKVLAKNQQEADNMLQGKSTPRAMRKASAAAGYGG